MDVNSKISFSWRFLCIVCIGICFSSTIFAQKTDTTKITFKPKYKAVSKVPAIKASVQPYRPFSNSNAILSTNNTTKSAKILTVLKVYPNPVAEQLNINLRLERETTLSIKITDMLGNEVVTLANERAPTGEQTKTYIIPTKLNAGIYFLRIVAGGEPKVMRISVL
jgi:hypothetical protein